MHFKMLSAICYNLDQSKTLSSGKRLSTYSFPCDIYLYLSKIEALDRRQNQFSSKIDICFWSAVSRKHIWKKEIFFFSFSNNVFSCLLFSKQALFFTCLQCKSFENTEKEKLHVTSNFSFSVCVFYPFRELSTIFIKFEIVVCKLFEFGSLKFVIWERVDKVLRGKS